MTDSSEVGCDTTAKCTFCHGDWLRVAMNLGKRSGGNCVLSLQFCESGILT